jgi:hypothetical protein
LLQSYKFTKFWALGRPTYNALKFDGPLQLLHPAETVLQNKPISLRICISFGAFEFTAHCLLGVVSRIS